MIVESKSRPYRASPMPGWRKALLLATLVLALVIGGEHEFLRTRASGAAGFDVASNCLLHRGKAPSDGQGGRHDCALCVYCVVAKMATSPAETPRITAWLTASKASFARRSVVFLRFSTTGGNKARASPSLV